MFTIVALGFLGSVGFGGCLAGFFAPLPRARQGALSAVGSAALAPLTGAVATVVQLINAFGEVAHAPPASKAALLEGAISVAMRSTWAGLLLGVLLAVPAGLALRRASSLSAPRSGI